ncbi:hypothetical protein TG4357_01942 [Thalassovita gelatinovora]|uniref:Flp pilus assembly protein TadG n=1 Tax=Thalassovita gelatinovora TaxID=53501 RepID=A0A0P1FBK7_THAGE|nr:hypothetical protein [Thalassovita gelatinovora]QIZ80118.1 hypothetical protein HFZ77_06335 [Thalassovita gelatinovora]CUH65571.1 hypothetical protein TG4357_01942 [Thalassovita gelatinovora]SER07414.1 hypothetical protein SAMN04488043_1158 [Thalassovita gelatinovora]
MDMMNKTKRLLRRFAKDSDGTVALEAVIVVPFLFWAFLASYVYFDAYRQTSVNIKANYTVGDLLSRETAAVNDAYIDSMQSLFAFLTKANSNASLRVTVAMWDEEDNMYKLDWSEARGSKSALNEAGINALADNLPSVIDNERVIVVETWSHYTPLFEVGLNESDIYELSFTSPRFAPQLAWAN